MFYLFDMVPYIVLLVSVGDDYETNCLDDNHMKRLLLNNLKLLVYCEVQLCFTMNLPPTFPAYILFYLISSHDY